MNPSADGSAQSEPYAGLKQINADFFLNRVVVNTGLCRGYGTAISRSPREHNPKIYYRK